MAVWDEEWSYDAHTSDLSVDGERWAHANITGADSGRYHTSHENHDLGRQLAYQRACLNARARLAAAAPDMARALLAMLERPAIDADMPCDDEARAALEKAGVRR